MALTDFVKLDRPLIVFDLETTGTDPQVARIVEIAYQAFRPDGTVASNRTLVNPGMAIPEGSSSVHGIKDEDMRNCRVCGRPAEEGHQACDGFKPIPRFSAMAANVAKAFSGCDFAGKNIRFDLRVLFAEMLRTQVRWSYADARVICVDRMEHLGEPRDLSSLYRRRTGREPKDSHSAAADVAMTVEILEAQFELFKALPRNLQLLHEKMWPGWIDTEGKFKVQGGLPCITFGKHAGPMKNVPRSYYEWMQGADFSDEVKAIAARAAKGEFPR